MKYFACPQSRSCGTNTLTAQKYLQKYKVRTGALDQTSPFCNHELNFSINAGLGDVMKVEFKAFTAGTKVTIASGETFEKAIGIKLDLM